MDGILECANKTGLPLFLLGLAVMACNLTAAAPATPTSQPAATATIIILNTIPPATNSSPTQASGSSASPSLGTLTITPSTANPKNPTQRVVQPNTTVTLSINNLSNLAS